jgi:hypothetical protein
MDIEMRPLASIRPYANPLADELFADRAFFVEAMKHFPRCQPIIPYLQQPKNNQTVENVLEGLQAESASRPERAKQLAAVRWYLHFMLWECERQWDEVANGITNYKTLLDQIEQCKRPDECVCLVTFNYDTLLDKVMATVGIQLSEIADYIRSDKYKLIRVHGSTKWAREVDTPLERIEELNVWQCAHQIIDKAPEIKVSRRFCFVDQHPLGKKGQTALYPAIAIPVESKTESHFECPDEHIAALRELLPDVRKILIVGWRGMEGHFVKILKEHLMSNLAIPVMVVSGNKVEATEIGKRLTRELPIQCTPAESGFTQFITGREGESFLKKHYPPSQP